MRCSTMGVLRLEAYCLMFRSSTPSCTVFAGDEFYRLYGSVMSDRLTQRSASCNRLVIVVSVSRIALHVFA